MQGGKRESAQFFGFSLFSNTKPYQSLLLQAFQALQASSRRAQLSRSIPSSKPLNKPFQALYPCLVKLFQALYRRALIAGLRAIVAIDLQVPPLKFPLLSSPLR
jgi:hypothetical protein